MTEHGSLATTTIDIRDDVHLVIVIFSGIASRSDSRACPPPTATLTSGGPLPLDLETTEEK